MPEAPVEGYLTITPGGSSATPTLGSGTSVSAKDYFAQKAKEDAASGPPPTGADPAPPIGLRDSHLGRVISVTPDIKYVGARGQNPTPFQTYAFTNDKAEHYSPDVRYEGDRAMRFNSDVSKTYGGQAGTGRGVKSDTYMDRTFPRTHATNVLINGSPAIRHGDLFDHNGSSPETANTIAKAQHPGPTDPKPAPKPSFWTRAWGAVRVVGGAIEGLGAVAGEAGGGALDATGVGAVAGVPLNVGSAVVGANAIDNVWTGAKEVWYGTPQESLAQQGAGAVASGLGASQSTVDATKEAVGVGQGFVGGGPGGVADEASTIGREANTADRLAHEANEARSGERAAQEATADGSGGVRVANPKWSKSRPKYGKDQVQQVWDKAKDENGDVYDPNTGEKLEWDQSQSRAGQWDMGHLPGHEYRTLYDDYASGRISEDEFLQQYRNPDNYQPESVSGNRGHQFEQK